MKHLLKNKLPFKTIWGFVLAIMTVTMTSCLDDDNGGPVIPTEPVAYVSLYQGSPVVSNMDIYVDDKRISSDPFEYSEFSGYSRFYTGERDLKFTPYNASNTLVDSAVTFKADSLYSVFVTGGDVDALDLLVVEDNIPDESEGKALIRVVHLSPDAPEVSLSEDEENSTPIFEDVAYKTASAFKEIDAGSTTFEILSATDGETIETVDNFNFIEGRVYSLIIRGFNNPPAGNSNNISVQVQPYFFAF